MAKEIQDMIEERKKTKLTKERRQDLKGQLRRWFLQGGDDSTARKVMGLNTRQFRELKKEIEEDALDRIGNLGFPWVAESVAELETLKEMCIEQAQVTEGVTKNGFLNSAIKASEARNRLLIETGLMSHTQRQIDEDLRKLLRKKRMTVDEQERELERIWETIMSGMGEEELSAFENRIAKRREEMKAKLKVVK